MPIRIEHQPSPYAVGLAAWQTGRGAAKQRQQKYVLDLWQQDRQNRYMEDRQDQRQQWMEGQQQKQQEAIDQRLQKTQQASDQRFQQQQQGIDERFQQQQQSMDAREQRRLLNGKAISLPAIPEDLADPEQRNKLAKKRAGIGQMAATIDVNDPAQMEQFEQEVLDYTDLISKAPKLSPYDKMLKDSTWLDKNNQPVEPNTPGAKPFRPDSSGRLIPAIDRSAEQAEAEKKATLEREAVDKAAAAERQRRQDEQAALNAWRTTEQKRLHDFNTMKGALDENKDPIYSSDDEIRMELDRVYGPQTAPPTISQSPATGPAQSAASSSGATAEVAAPAPGAPSGVVPVQMMPDGTLAPAQAAAVGAAARPAPEQFVEEYTPEEMQARGYGTQQPSKPTPAPGKSFDQIFDEMSNEELGIKPVTKQQPQTTQGELPATSPNTIVPSTPTQEIQQLTEGPGILDILGEDLGKPNVKAPLSVRQQRVSENAKSRGERVRANSQLSSRQRERRVAQQAQQQKLPPGAVQLEDGSVEYNGVIYRRRQQ